MREIKFRGKNNKGQWCYGNLVLRVDGTYLVTPKKGSLIGNYGAVYEKTIGQYTGIKDKNGKEIFENMIINNKYIVDYDFGKFVLKNIESGDIADFKKDGVYEITREYFE